MVDIWSTLRIFVPCFLCRQTRFFSVRDLLQAVNFFNVDEAAVGMDSPAARSADNLRRVTLKPECHGDRHLRRLFMANGAAAFKGGLPLYCAL